MVGTLLEWHGPGTAGCGLLKHRDSFVGVLHLGDRGQQGIWPVNCPQKSPDLLGETVAMPHHLWGEGQGLGGVQMVGLLIGALDAPVTPGLPKGNLFFFIYFSQQCVQRS